MKDLFLDLAYKAIEAVFIVITIFRRKQK